MSDSGRWRLAMSTILFFAFLSVVEFTILLRYCNSGQSGASHTSLDVSNIDAVLGYPNVVEVPKEIPVMTRRKVIDKQGKEVDVSAFGATVGILNHVDYLQGHFLGWQQGLEVLALEGKAKLMARAGEWHSGGGGTYEWFHPQFAEGFSDATKELQRRMRLLESATDQELNDCARRVIAPAETDPCAEQGQ
jgi:hypothetical protein